VNLAASVWRRLLRKRWVLALVFRLSLEERAVRDLNLLQVQDRDQPRPLWKVQLNSGHSSRPSNQCLNSVQGKHLLTDELRKDLLVNASFLSRAAVAFQNLFMAVEDLFELDRIAKDCYGVGPPELFPASRCGRRFCPLGGCAAEELAA
ncbi:hypothetical protein FD754_013959, partial [Muntiacus muntjak]